MRKTLDKWPFIYSTYRMFNLLYSLGLKGVMMKEAALKTSEFVRRYLKRKQ